jgi:hypothetical protein
MPFGLIEAVAAEWCLAPYDVDDLLHPLRLNDQRINVEESVKHHTVLNAMRPLALDTTGDSNELVRNTANACNTTDVDFGGVTVIDGAVNELYHRDFPCKSDSNCAKAPHPRYSLSKMSACRHRYVDS